MFTLSSLYYILDVLPPLLTSKTSTEFYSLKSDFSYLSGAWLTTPQSLKSSFLHFYCSSPSYITVFIRNLKSDRFQALFWAPEPQVKANQGMWLLTSLSLRVLWPLKRFCLCKTQNFYYHSIFQTTLFHRGNNTFNLRLHASKISIDEPYLCPIKFGSFLFYSIFFMFKRESNPLKWSNASLVDHSHSFTSFF